MLYAQTDNNPSGQRNPTTGTIWRIDNVSGVATVRRREPRAARAASRRCPTGGWRWPTTRINASGSSIPRPASSPISRACRAARARRTAPAPTRASSSRTAVAVLAGDRIIVADHDAHILREVSLAGVVTTFAGDGVAGTIDGPRAGARFDAPRALAADASGAVFVSDDGAHRIRRIAANGTVTTVAGDGTGGFIDGAGNMAAVLRARRDRGQRGWRYDLRGGRNAAAASLQARTIASERSR